MGLVATEARASNRGLLTHEPMTHATRNPTRDAPACSESVVATLGNASNLALSDCNSGANSTADGNSLTEQEPSKTSSMFVSAGASSNDFCSGNLGHSRRSYASVLRTTASKQMVKSQQKALPDKQTVLSAQIEALKTSLVRSGRRKRL